MSSLPTRRQGVFSGAVLLADGNGHLLGCIALQRAAGACRQLGGAAPALLSECERINGHSPGGVWLLGFCEQGAAL